MAAQKVDRTDIKSAMDSTNTQVTEEEEFLVINGSANKIGTDYNYKRKFIWKLVFYVVVLHALGLYGLYRACFSCLRLTLLYTIIVGYACQTGIYMGAHRLYAHKAFKAKLSLRIVIAVLHTIAGEHSTYRWALVHRAHHKYCDTDADPHNASRGFFFSHVGWLISERHPAVSKYVRTIDMSDLEADKVVMFQKKYYLPLHILLNLIIVAVPVWLWNETVVNSLFVSYFFRFIYFLHASFCINSWAHLFGTKPYDKNILPVETNMVSYLSGGEGWHNYHHTFPWDYRAAEFGLHYSLTTLVIDLCSYLGLAYDLRAASKQLIQRRIIRTG